MPAASWHPRAVVFDLDGLMVNTEQLYQLVGTELLRRRGKPFEPELLDEMMGRPARVALDIMIRWHSLDATVAAALGRNRRDLCRDPARAAWPACRAWSNCSTRLEAAGIPKAIATSSGPRFVANVLGRFNLAPRFQFILTSDDIVDGKPHPEIYLKAAQRFGLPPADLLVLEDSQNGCRAAIAAGTFAVAVPGGHSRRQDFSGASLVLDSLADRRLYEVLGLP